MTLPRSPFKGLAYFGDSETDWLFFFGREPSESRAEARSTGSASRSWWRPT